MKIEELVKKFTYVNSKGIRLYKFDSKEGELIWRGKKVRGNHVLLKQKMNLLKTKISKKDGGDKIILKKGVCFISINTKPYNATVKVLAPKGLTLNQCLKKSKYLIQFIAMKHWIKDDIGSDTPTLKNYQKLSEFKSYQVSKNYFIINV